MNAQTKETKTGTAARKRVAKNFSEDEPTKSAAGAEEAEVRGQRLRIKIRAYESRTVDASAKQIVETALRYGAKIAGPVPLPTEIHRYTVNRSTFVHKDSRDQYEMRVHKRLIDILNPNPKIIDALMNLNLPAGVDVEIKM